MRKKSTVQVWVFHIFMFVVFAAIYQFLFGAPRWAALVGASIITAIGAFAEDA